MEKLKTRKIGKVVKIAFDRNNFLHGITASGRVYWYDKPRGLWVGVSDNTLDE